MRFILAAASLLGLAACAPPTNAPLVSAQYPPSAMSFNSPAQTLNSMPPGSANVSAAPNATSPDYASFAFHAF